MLYLKLVSLSLLLLIANNSGDAAELNLNNLNISWQYTSEATAFNVSAMLTSGINPGINCSLIIFKKFHLIVCMFFCCIKLMLGWESV